MQNTLCQVMHGISLDDTYVSDLDLADNIIWKTTPKMLNTYSIVLFKLPKMKINASKTKFCSIDPNIVITCSGEKLERVEKFAYLGLSIKLNGDITGEIKLRCAKSLGSINSGVAIFQPRSNPKFTTLASGAPYCIAVKRGHSRHLILKKLDSFEIRCSRSILRPSRPIKSSDIRGILKLDSSLSTTIQKRRLKWLWSGTPP